MTYPFKLYNTTKHRYNRTPEERLEGLSIPEPNSGCWLWLGRLNEWGYGVFRLDNKTVLAHRASWIVNYGEIPDGKKVCHSCDMPPCINPDHLWIGTDDDNAQDCIRKGRAVHPRGCEHPNVSITEDQAMEIISRLRTEEDLAIATYIGCTENAVNLIRRNRTWRHLVR